MKLQLLLVLAGAMAAQAQDVPVPAGEDPNTSYAIITQGSTTTSRPNSDGSMANVYVYVGGAFPSRTHFVDFQYLFDLSSGGNSWAYITPILFEQTLPGIFTVRGIGQGHVVFEQPFPQTFPFTILIGEKVALNSKYTFGFINALVDVRGIPILKSKGAVDFDYSTDSGPGLGGPITTNAWGATNEPVVVSLGATFGGPLADFPFPLPLRTYSANASGVLVLP